MKTLKQFTGVIICLSILCLPLTMISVNAETTTDLTVQIDNGKSITIKDTNCDGYYEIGSADELYAFAQIVNNGNASINAMVTDNIIVNQGTVSQNSTDARVWTPIADGPINGDSARYNENDFLYNGIFDGNGKTISGLYFNNSEEDYVGLFAGLESKGVVKNLTIENSYIEGHNNVGAFVGFCKGTITNCTNTSTIKAFSVNGGIAGCIGINSNGNISNCTNSGYINGSATTGGIVGNSENSVNNCINTGKITGSIGVGGIAGINYGLINNCINKATITGVEFQYNCAYYLGGISGCSYNGSITGCTNNGYANCSGGDYAGGIVGKGYCNVIKNCLNTGRASGLYMAGIVSYSTNDNIENCCNTYYLYGTGTYCNIVNVFEGSTYVEPSANLVKNCYYYDDGKTDCNSIENCIEAKTKEQFANGEVAYLLQSNQQEQIWGQTIGSDSHPVLNGKAVMKTSDNKYCN